VAATDQPEAADGTAVREALPERSLDREVLRQRLERLPPGHPSSLAADDRSDGGSEGDVAASSYRDSPDVGPATRDLSLTSPDGGRAESADARELTDAEDAERVQMIRDELGWARREGLATDKRLLDDEGTWSPERQDAHDAIVNDLYNAAAEVPCEHQAIMAGGLGGSGKSTVLDRYANVDRARYLTINPDDIKEQMAKRGLIPELNGLSPMEASDLVHEESSAIAKMLARRAMAEGKNVIWDITMSSPDGVLSRLDALDAKGYSIKGIFVDITIDEAVSRAHARHRRGHEEYRAGVGFGGRYVPPEVIRAQTDPEWGSINRRIFEQVKPRFAEWAIYDNNGAAPQLVQASQEWNPEEER
jgi:predicted ABC-type ATPase